VAFHSNPRGRYGQEAKSKEGEKGESQEVIKTAPPKAGPNDFGVALFVFALAG
jgi:hypothetical protein